MNFERLLLKAKEGNADGQNSAEVEDKNAGTAQTSAPAKDLYQELVSTLLQCIQRFQIIE